MSWLSNLFSGSKKQDTSYTGQQPLTSLRQTQGGPLYYDTISKRLSGEGVGYGPDYANTASSPVIARMRSQFSSYDLPELKSELSAQGRRKGSGGFDQIRRAYQEQGLNEGDVWSQLYQKDQDQQRTEVNDALGRVGDYASNEANMMNNRANFDMANYKGQLATAADQRAEGNAAGMRAIGVGTALLPSSGNLSSMYSRLMPSNGQSYVSQNYAPVNPSKVYPGVSSLSSAFNQRLRIK